MTRNMMSLLAAAAVLALGCGSANADGKAELGSEGFVYKTKNMELNLGGRLHLDAAQVDNGSTDSSDEEVRRARLELGIRLYDKWRIRIDREFTNDGGWRNVWLGYEVNDQLSLKAGNFIAPFSMEDVGSSNDTMFMERSLVQALAPGFGVGAGATYQGRHFGISGGYFTDAIDEEDNVQAKKGDGVSARAIWRPIDGNGRVLHFGFGLDRREFGAGDVRRISTGPEANLAPTVVTTGNVANMDVSNSYNAEAAWSAGPVLVQGQYVTSDLERTIGRDLTVDGYYLQVGWVLTGERYRYGDSAGVFTGPRPKGKWGAVELAARVSSLDLSEAGIGASGKADDYTIGGNWYVGKNFRLMANYVHSEVDTLNPALDRDVDVLQARAQVDF